MAKKVLVVDDEPDIREYLITLLTKLGYDAAAAINGKEALKLLEKEKFDLVLLDLFMPELSGRDVLRIIRETPKLRKQKVAFLTVASFSETGKKIIGNLKPEEYFLKPIDTDDFEKRLGKLLGRR